MISKVDKVAVFRYKGQIYESPADIRKALRADVIRERIDRHSKLEPDDPDEVVPELADYLADQWDRIEREISTAMAGTGID